MSNKKQNILFVLYNDFSSNSAIHIHGFANNLVAKGINCTVAVPNNKKTISILGEHHYEIIEYEEIGKLKKIYQNKNESFLVHFWTPREIVRKFYEKLKLFFNFEFIIHLEDNEEYLIKKFLQKDIYDIIRTKDYVIPENLSHPENYKKFIGAANGVTVLNGNLKEFVPAAIPCQLIFPGIDKRIFYPRPANIDFKKKFGVPLDKLVLCYTGNVHSANAEEMRSLYLALAILNREELPTVLVRTGIDHVDFLRDNGSWVKEHIIELGFVERTELGDILGLADILIQPGRADEFNKYRLPSKLPEFFAMGKPIILPKTNIGLIAEHLNNAYILEKADGLGIANAVRTLIADIELRKRISNGAVEFAARYFDWDKNTDILLSFYNKVLNI